MNTKIVLVSLLLTFLNADLYYSGKINIPYNFYLRNYKNTESPIRFINLNTDYSFSNLDFKSNTAFEYAWNSDNCNPINFREYYFSYYPSFGEINIGKQIISWGFADGNNPTDNINPYDFNYMFETGINRKVGVHSISSIIYYNDLRMNIVISYDNFKSNLNPRLPFPFSPIESQSHFEYGFDFQYNMAQAEIGLSYLSFKDRFFNNSIQAIGTNLLYFYNQFSFRFENAFFIANNNEKFLQAIVQVEYPQIFDFTFGTQVFGTYDINAKKIYGVGSPIFILSEYMLILSSSRTFNDDTIELNKFLMYNLGTGGGYSIGGEVTYSISDNLQTSINISKFIKGPNFSSFSRLEKYSNLKIIILYFF